MKKYLYLADAMYRNRCDWSNGYNYVEDALDNFEIETELDHEIVEELEEIMYEYDCVDGRHFRDCDYNYNWIYENLLTSEEKEIYDKMEEE